MRLLGDSWEHERPSLRIETKLSRIRPCPAVSDLRFTIIDGSTMSNTLSGYAIATYLRRSRSLWNISLVGLFPVNVSSNSTP